MKKKHRKDIAKIFDEFYSRLFAYLEKNKLKGQVVNDYIQRSILSLLRVMYTKQAIYVLAYLSYATAQQELNEEDKLAKKKKVSKKT